MACQSRTRRILQQSGCAAALPPSPYPDVFRNLTRRDGHDGVLQAAITTHSSKLEALKIKKNAILIKTVAI
jgi:hypothetical protein